MFCWNLLLAVVSCIVRLCCVHGHVVWTCPSPRSTNSGLKNGPCGDIGSVNDATVVTLNPGPFTVLFQETVTHSGAPFRVSLSLPNQDVYDQCILLNHIPHKSNTASGYYAVTINIPDIKCENCALQLIQVMTDKIASFSPGATSCTYNPNDTQSWANLQCGSNYHSCSNVRINGTQPFSPSLCVQPAGWTFATANNVNVFSAGEVGTYKGLFLNDSKSPMFVETHYSGYCSQNIIGQGGAAPTATGPGFGAGGPAATYGGNAAVDPQVSLIMSIMLVLVVNTFSRL